MKGRAPRRWCIAGLNVFQDRHDRQHCYWIGHDGKQWHWWKGLLCEEGPRGPKHWEQFDGSPPMTLDAAVGWTVGYTFRKKEMEGDPDAG